MFPKLIISDTHLHERAPRTRVDEFLVLLRKLRIIGIKNKCKSLTILGDLYDRNTLVSIKLIMAIADMFRVFPHVDLLVGNHDTPIKGYEYSLLDIFRLAGVNVVSVPKVIDRCLFLPYYSVGWDEERYDMVFMHKDIIELNPYNDASWALSLDELPDAPLLFNGHLHKNAEIVKPGKKLVQVGAPYPCTWGDEYENNRFAYIVQRDGSYQRIELNITADSTAPDAESYAMQRVRTEKREPSVKDVAFIIDDIKQHTLRIDDCLSAVSTSPLTKRLIKSVVRNVEVADLDGDKL